MTECRESIFFPLDDYQTTACSDLYRRVTRLLVISKFRREHVIDYHTGGFRICFVSAVDPNVSRSSVFLVSTNNMRRNGMSGSYTSDARFSWFSDSGRFKTNRIGRRFSIDLNRFTQNVRGTDFESVSILNKKNIL